jgi:hypothetical protein
MERIKGKASLLSQDSDDSKPEEVSDAPEQRDVTETEGGTDSLPG